MTEDKAWGEVDARIGIHEVLAARAELGVVRAVALRELNQARAIEVYAIDLTIIGVLGRITAKPDEGHLLRGFIKVQHGFHHPSTAGHGIERRACLEVHAVQMRPARPLRHPQGRFIWQVVTVRTAISEDELRVFLRQ